MSAPPTEGVQRGYASRQCPQTPNPKCQEGAGTHPCQGFGGVTGACNAPLQAYAVTVQQNAARVRGVPEILLSVPPRLGARGVDSETVPAGFDSLCQSYAWIPASAGMTEEVQRSSCRESEGVPQISISCPPRVGGRGLKQGSETASTRGILLLCSGQLG